MTNSNQNLVKCFLSIQVNDPNNSIDYTLSHEHSVETDGNIRKYSFNINITKRNSIKILVNRRDDPTSHLIVKEVKVGNTTLSHLDSFSFFKPSVGPIRKTYGFIDSDGVYVINIHGNLVSQNYLGFLLSLTK